MSSSALSATIHQLPAEGMYVVRVRAVSSTGVSNYTEYVYSGGGMIRWE